MSQELFDNNFEATSSFTLVANEALSTTLVIVPLWAHPPSMYDKYWEDDDLMRGFLRWCNDEKLGFPPLDVVETTNFRLRYHYIKEE